MKIPAGVRAEALDSLDWLIESRQLLTGSPDIVVELVTWCRRGQQYAQSEIDRRNVALCKRHSQSF
jgi:hypothetical protein